MFGRPVTGAPAPPPQAPMQSGYGSGGAGSNATSAFRAPVPAGPPPDSAQQGPSEYTQMMRAPSASPQSPQAPQAAAGPQSPQMQLKMPPMQMPQVQAPQIQGAHVQPPQVHAQPPQMQMPQVSMAAVKPPQLPTEVGVKAPGPNMLLIAIFCLLAFLVGALLMVLLLKK